jgi:hypothetical protein
VEPASQIELMRSQRAAIRVRRGHLVIGRFGVTPLTLRKRAFAAMSTIWKALKPVWVESASSANVSERLLTV